MSTGLNRPKSLVQPHANDWLMSSKEMIEVGEWLDEEVTIDTKHDVPYTAGYNKQGSKVYIDKDIPRTIDVDGVEVDLYKSFSLHETVEVSLESEPYYLPYQLAHQIALRAEQAYVESIGANWNSYNRRTMKIVDAIYKRKSFDNVPKDLDLEPYIDEGDKDCLKRMGLDKDGKSLK